MIGMIVDLAIVALYLAGVWKILEKMGKPGLGGLIPIYNLFLIAQILGKPAWWFILGLIPFVNIMFWIPVAEKFGKSVGYAVGLALLGFVFAPMLGFGEAQYSGGSAPAAPAMPT
jgi:hypothetical protein